MGALVSGLRGSALRGGEESTPGRGHHSFDQVEGYRRAAHQDPAPSSLGSSQDDPCGVGRVDPQELVERLSSCFRLVLIKAGAGPGVQRNPRAHTAWMHRGNPDPAPGHVVAQRLTEASQGVLARDVCRLSTGSDQPEERGDVDDLATGRGRQSG